MARQDYAGVVERVQHPSHQVAPLIGRKCRCGLGMRTLSLTSNVALGTTSYARVSNGVTYSNLWRRAAAGLGLHGRRGVRRTLSLNVRNCGGHGRSDDVEQRRQAAGLLQVHGIDRIDRQQVLRGTSKTAKDPRQGLATAATTAR